MTKLLKSLSNDLALPEGDLLYLIRSSPYRYKVYEIAKRTPGKKRVIAQPAREVKPLQYWVMANVLSEFPIHPAATGYRKGKSIVDNAAPHAAQRYLCKLDFKDFFPSIKSTHFEKFMRLDPLAENWSSEEVGYLSRILFWQKKRGTVPQLSIGAPSSPLVSNILLYSFDVQVHDLCANRGITYTRYADDMSFSTNRREALHEIEADISGICKKVRYPKLNLNLAKTVHASKKGLRKITGLVLTNEGHISIGRSKKRELRAAVHHYLQSELNEEEILELAGSLAYIKSVEPAFLKRLAEKYGGRAISQLMSTHRMLDRD